MRVSLYEKPLTTDQITSVTIDDTVSEVEWKLVRVAVGHGLLHPNIGLSNPDEMPWREGTFHLAYALAPHFLLLPRRGKSVKLATVKKFQDGGQIGGKTNINYGHGQLPLFGEGDEQ